MTDAERDAMLRKIDKSLLTHLARSEAITESVGKLMSTVFGISGERRGLIARVLVIEGGLGLITVVGTVVLTAIIMQIMGS
jgi:hypothetical protein